MGPARGPTVWTNITVSGRRKDSRQNREISGLEMLGEGTDQRLSAQAAGSVGAGAYHTTASRGALPNEVTIRSFPTISPCDHSPAGQSLRQPGNHELVGSKESCPSHTQPKSAPALQSTTTGHSQNAATRSCVAESGSVSTPVTAHQVVHSYMV